jgi:hypothetical protein
VNDALRLLGIVAVAAWLGASLLFLMAVTPGMFSAEMERLLEPRNYPYFSAAIYSILLKRVFYFQLLCALASISALLAERLYAGSQASKGRLGLLLTLTILCLLDGFSFQPKMKAFNGVRYSSAAKPEARKSAMDGYIFWGRLSTIARVVSVAGLGWFLLRAGNPPKSSRFLEAGKFRS